MNPVTLVSLGGRVLPPHLEAPMAEVAAAYAEAKDDPEFIGEYEQLLADYVGRPSPLFLAKRLSAELGRAKIYLKREDLNHTGAHKINHTLGEVLLAKRMGKKKVIAETGAGQHGVALATAAALLGLECEVHMGAIDIPSSTRTWCGCSSWVQRSFQSVPAGAP